MLSYYSTKNPSSQGLFAFFCAFDSFFLLGSYLRQAVCLPKVKMQSGLRRAEPSKPERKINRRISPVDFVTGYNIFSTYGLLFKKRILNSKRRCLLPYMSFLHQICPVGCKNIFQLVICVGKEDFFPNASVGQIKAYEFLSHVYR